MKNDRWTKRWNTWIDPKPVLPGVFRRKEGGFLVRGRASNPITGKEKEIRLVVHSATPAEALGVLEHALEKVRSGDLIERHEPKPLFSEYAAQLFERKVTTGEIKSASGREKWSDILELHLIPVFGNAAVDELRRPHVEAWRTDLGKQIRGGKLSPFTANTRLAVLKVIVNTAVAELELDRNAVAGIKPFDTSDWDTYTDEEPNSLTPDEVPRFLELGREHYPQYFALMALGFATGLRPSTLRPLRRSGDHADVLWDERVLLVRQSQSRGTEVMRTTKTKRHQRLALPEELIEILRSHVARLPEGPMRDSELLFPSITGGFLSRSALDHPFGRLGKLMGLTKTITPRAMRRTFQDLARAAAVSDVVTRAVSGHATEQMQHHYSTVNADEMRQSLARIVDLARFRDAHRVDDKEVQQS